MLFYQKLDHKGILTRDNRREKSYKKKFIQ